MTAIINDVLEMEAIASSKKSMESTSTKIDDIIQYLDQTFSDMASKKGIDLNFECDKDLRLHLCKGNELNLKVQVFSNLLSNAIKFSTIGDSIFFIVKEGDGWIDFIIRDSGIGMPQELIGNIFRDSVPTSRVGTDGEKGTGFGMPITKKYLELFGGVISVESTSIKESVDDHGTEFTVKLPSCTQSNSYSNSQF